MSRTVTKRNQRGATTVLFTYMLLFVALPVIGLAVDATVTMWEKARLSSAVDAAALAAGRSLNVGLDLASQTANARQTAINYFNGNFVPGHMRSSVVGGTPTINITQSSSGTRSVTIDVTVNVPLYFLPILGYQNSTIAAHGQASRRDANMILVLDRSGSMFNSGSCTPMIGSAQTFVNFFVNGRDEIGLITFSTTGNPHDYDPTIYFKSQTPSLNTVLGTLVCAGGTNSAEGLSLAYQQIKNINKPGAQNIVVFFSDGYPTALTFGTSGFGTRSGNLPLPVITSAGIAAGTTDQRYGWASPNSSNPDYDTLYNTVASPCVSSSLAGTVVSLAGQDPDPTGPTAAVVDPAAIAITSTAGANISPTSTNATGCNFRNTGAYGSNSIRVGRRDIAYLPDADAYGNPTTTSLASQPMSNPHSADLFSYGGASHIRPDTPKGIVNASFVAADNAAYRIRSDTNYNTVIYTIGLGAEVDTELMQRMANDPASTSYSTAQATGAYYYSPTSSQLQAAFQQVASQIVRISQ